MKCYRGGHLGGLYSWLQEELKKTPLPNTAWRRQRKYSCTVNMSIYSTCVLVCLLYTSTAQEQPEMTGYLQPGDERFNAIVAEDGFFDVSGPDYMVPKPGNLVVPKTDSTTDRPTTAAATELHDDDKSQPTITGNDDNITSDIQGNSTDNLSTETTVKFVDDGSSTKLPVVHYEDERYTKPETQSPVFTTGSYENNKPIEIHNTARKNGSNATTVIPSEVTIAQQLDVVNYQTSIEEQKPTVGDQKPTVEDKKPTIDDQTSTIESQKSTIEDQESTVEDQKSTVEDIKSTVEDQKSTDTEETTKTTNDFPTTTKPMKADELSLSAEEMNRKKLSGQVSSTEKTLLEDTPPYPPLPTLPVDEEGVLLPSPPTKKGHLDIRISIPHIFHLSWGHTEDGRRRLGIQAPFFNLDFIKRRTKALQK